ncbi:MAG: MFS transporter [Fimbriimonadaceae bacterium]
MPSASDELRAPAAVDHTVYTYLGFLVLVLPFTGIWGTHADFILKDQLRLSPETMTHFGFIVALPAYFGFLFGMIRDRWSPLGRRDQGWLLLSTVLIGVLFLCLAGIPVTYGALLCVALLNGVLHQFIGAAQQGLTAALGREHAMSGRLSAWWKGLSGFPGLINLYLSGVIADDFRPRGTFLLTAVIAFAVAGFTLWRPKAIYEDPVEAKPIAKRNLLAEFGRLVSCKALYPPLVLLLLWNFTPGVGTSMQFFLTNTLHATRSQFTAFGAVFGGFFIPTYFLHGYLSTRFKLRSILWASTVIAVPQILPLLTVHSIQSAIWAGVPMGLMGGFATAAYFDLLIRSCPRGLEGAAMLLGSGMFVLSDRIGNVAGASLYAWHGFSACAWATALVYGCMLPVLLFVPKSLTATKDGEPLAAGDTLN